MLANGLTGMGGGGYNDSKGVSSITIFLCSMVFFSDRDRQQGIVSLDPGRLKYRYYNAWKNLRK